jgi:hypothetical protein
VNSTIYAIPIRSLRLATFYSVRKVLRDGEIFQNRTKSGAVLDLGLGYRLRSSVAVSISERYSDWSRVVGRKRSRSARHDDASVAGRVRLSEGKKRRHSGNNTAERSHRSANRSRTHYASDWMIFASVTRLMARRRPAYPSVPAQPNDRA